MDDESPQQQHQIEPVVDNSSFYQLTITLRSFLSGFKNRMTSPLGHNI